MVRTMMMVAIAVVGVGGAAAFGQVIRLSEKAVVGARQDVRLGNIATITGVDAATAANLADTVVLPNVQSGRTIRAESVLMAVIAQLGGSDVGNRLQLAGAAECIIEIETPGAPAVAAPATVVAVAPAPEVAAAPAVVAPSPTIVTASVVPVGMPEANEQTEPGTLRNLLLNRLRTELSAGAEDLVVQFKTDDALLDRPVREGTAWQFEPLTRTFLGTVMWRADLVQHSRVLQKLTVGTYVERHVKVLVAAKQIGSGMLMTKDDWVTADVLLDRMMPTLCTEERNPLGLEAQRPITVGAQLDQRDFKPVQMAQQGGQVTVVFVSGNLRVKMKARAMQSGNLHEQITVKNDQTKQDYQATLIGKRLAVIGKTLTEAQEQALREMP